MDDRAQELLQRFTDLANKDILHPSDWQRFYDLLVGVHSRHVPIDSEGVRDALWASMFSTDKARELAGFFIRGLDLLKRYDELRRN